MQQIYLDRLAEEIRRHIGAVQPKAAEVKVITKVDPGEATENICNLVDTNKVDLIIMATVGNSGIQVGKMIGSVTSHICQNVPIPVMLIRPQNIKKVDINKQLIKHMLIPLDGSELSKMALPVTEELAIRLKAATTIFQMAMMIRVYDNGIEGSAYVDYSKYDEEEKKRVMRVMQALEADLKAKGINATNIVTSGFDAASDILEVCKKNNIDLVVMSTHGQSGLGRWVFGSIAEKVLKYGETPLLLVHARA
jgi:nucleotide-binding universal stress UspA family protein